MKNQRDPRHYQSLSWKFCNFKKVLNFFGLLSIWSCLKSRRRAFSLDMEGSTEHWIMLLKSEGNAFKAFWLGVESMLMHSITLPSVTPTFSKENDVGSSHPFKMKRIFFWRTVFSVSTLLSRLAVICFTEKPGSTK